MTSTLPLNIGITGHRDIPSKDHAKLQKTIIDELNSIQKRFPNTTINVLCGLAEGADQLAANAALSQNVNVIAVLPFEQSKYEKDFTSPNALSDFRKLLKRCTDIRVCQTTAHLQDEEAYSKLGQTLVSCCDIVFALWDGMIEVDKETKTNNALPGGTADVVTMCVAGIMDENSLLFSKPNQTYCKWLVTNREQHESLPCTIASEKEIGTWKKLPISGNQDEAILEDILNKIERFNLDSAMIPQQDKDASVTYLLGSVEAKALFPSIQKLIDTYSVADCLAQARQKQRIFSLKLITMLSFIAIAAQQVYVSLYATVGWFVAHLALVLLVITIYRLFFAGTESKEEQFVEWRVFAENLRVQIFWHIAGIPDKCANNYRTTKFNEMDWIIDNLNKLCFTVDPPKDANVAFVKEQWIADQRDYFYGEKGKSGRAAQLLSKSNQYKKSSMVFFLLALIAMAFSTFKIKLNLLPMLSDDMFFIIVALLFIGSALFKTFSVQMGFEELSQRYLRTGYFFQQAINRMDLLDRQKAKGQTHAIEKYQNVIKIIGVEALSENAAWLQLHKMNAYQVQIT
ncbi:hypothetical protein [Glaciecola sp. SC05]|uniref:hypothetical protein n=1 Tax=Glaciecola sp. SC05 TaxID=1987355 RepID=UPI003527FA05